MKSVGKANKVSHWLGKTKISHEDYVQSGQYHWYVEGRLTLTRTISQHINQSLQTSQT